MTKEEIINHLKRAYLPENLECDGAFCDGCWKDVVRQSIKMIEEYDQQTTEKNSEIERLKAELNELKERHKSDIINAIASCLYEAGDDDLEQEFHYKKAEKYYKQKFESND